MKRWLPILILTALTFGLVVGAALVWRSERSKREFYTDGDAIRMRAAAAQLRDVLWRPPIALPSAFNADDDERDPVISADGEALIFVRGHPGANADLWYAQRDTPAGDTAGEGAETWRDPQPLIALNSAADELSPELSADGRILFFASNREGGHGGYDLWAAERDDWGAQGWGGWSAPVNLGPQINTAFDERDPALAHDGSFYFSSNRIGAPPGDVAVPAEAGTPVEAGTPSSAQSEPALDAPTDFNLYRAHLDHLTASNPQPLDALNTPANETSPALSPSGDFLYFASDRIGGYGGLDLYRSRIRDGQHLPATNLGQEVNSRGDEREPALSMGGFKLHFSSDRGDEAGTTRRLDSDLFYTTSREVFHELGPREPFDWAGLWEFIGPALLWLLAALLALLLLLLSLRGVRSTRLSLLARCVLASLIAHLILMILLSFWQVTTQVAQMLERGDGAIKVALLAPAQGAGLEAQVRGGLTEVEFTAERSETAQRETAAAQEAPALAQLAAEQRNLAPAEPAELEASANEAAPAEAAPPSTSATLLAAMEQPIETSVKTPAPGAPQRAAEAALQVSDDGRAPAPAQAQSRPATASAAAPATLPPSPNELADRNPSSLSPSARPVEAAPAPAALATLPRDEATRADPLATTFAVPRPADGPPVQGAEAQATVAATGPTTARVAAVPERARQPTSDAAVALAPQKRHETSSQSAVAAAQAPDAAGTARPGSSSSPPASATALESAAAALASVAMPAQGDPGARGAATSEHQVRIAGAAPGASTPASLQGVAAPVATENYEVSPAGGTASIPGERLAEAREVQQTGDALARSLASLPVSTAERAPALGSASARVGVPQEMASPQAAASGPGISAAPAAIEARRASATTAAPAPAGNAALAALQPAAVVAPEAGQSRVDVAVREPWVARQLAGVGTGDRPAGADLGRSTTADAPLALPAGAGANVPAAAGASEARLAAAPASAARADAINRRGVSMPAAQVSIAPASPSGGALAEAARSTVSGAKASNREAAPGPALHAPGSRGAADLPPAAALAVGFPGGSSQLEQARPRAPGSMPSQVSPAGVAPDDTRRAEFAPAAQPPLASVVRIAPGAKDSRGLRSGEATASAAIAANVPDAEAPAAAPAIEPQIALEPLALASGADIDLRLPTEVQPLIDPFVQRSEEARQEIVEKMGGSNETEEAVRRALAWLAVHQSPDGRWAARGFDETCGKCAGEARFDADIATTSLALLCFLAADHTHVKENEYRAHVGKAIDWLISQQKPDGDLRGEETMYSHGIASIALAETYGMTRDDRLVGPVNRATRFIFEARNRAVGGWRYEPGQAGDTSVLGWQVMAFVSARRAGLEVPQEMFETAGEWLQRVSTRSRPGLYAYQPGQRYSPSMTAEGMFVLQLLGTAHDDARMQGATRLLMNNLPDWENDPNTYYWYYATLAMFQRQGDDWQRWNEAITRELLASQRQNGAAAGSWDPEDNWSKIGGRVYQTALCTLSLEVYYRYLPMYAAVEQKKEE